MEFTAATTGSRGRPVGLGLAAAVVSALATAAPASAQLTTPRSVIAGGGGTVTAGALTLSATAGQAAVGVVVSEPLRLSAGFWGELSMACNAADLAPPFGLLDLADISAFTGGFVAMNPAADLNNDGLFDLTDISLFTGAFVAGCP